MTHALTPDQSPDAGASPDTEAISVAATTVPEPNPSKARSGRRYAWALALAGLVTAACAGLGIFLAAQPLWVAVAIGLVSVTGFHMVALLTSDCVRCWRCVDYPWVLASFMAILVALTNIQETARLEPLRQALDDHRAAYDTLIYYLKGVITNDCHPKPSRARMWTPSPEPYSGACDRMEHFLPQIELAAIKDTKLGSTSPDSLWADNILMPDTSPVGSWAGLYSAARFLKDSAHKVSAIRGGLRASRASPIAQWVRSDALKYWYFTLAFFLGLRLSRVSADLLGPRDGVARLHALLLGVERYLKRPKRPMEEGSALEGQAADVPTSPVGDAPQTERH